MRGLGTKMNNKIEIFGYKNEKEFLELFEKEAKEKLEDCQKRAPNVFTNEAVKQYVAELKNMLMEEFSKQGQGIDFFIKNNPKFLEKLKNTLTKDLEKNCCNATANIYFEAIGNGNREKGQKIFNKMFLLDNKNYQKCYRVSEEFRQFCDSMSESNKKYFKNERNGDFVSAYSSFYKWVFIISVPIISIPYLLIKKFAFKAKKIPTITEIVERVEWKEFFIILSKGDLY